MSDPTTPATYTQEAAAADKLLDELLGNIRRDFDAGEITALEAAGDRINALEEHLATIKQLRTKYFGGSQS
jgi:hypothetical protein